MSALSRRRFLGLTGGAMGALATGGCVTAAPAEPVTDGSVGLRFWTHDPSYTATFQAALGDRDIMRGSPYAPSLEVTAAAGTDLLTRTITQFMADGAPPDLLGIIISEFPRVMKGGLAESLFLDLTEIAEPFGDDLLRRSPYTVDGRLYGLDSDTSISVLYYRPDEFARAGLPADAATWEDMLDIGGRLNEATGKSVGMVSNGDNTSLYNTYLQVLVQRGGSPFDADGALTIDTDESVAALDLIQRGVANGAFLVVGDPYGAAAAAAIKSGLLVALTMPSWYRVYGLEANAPEQAGQWRLRTLPRFEDGGHIAANLGGTGFTVSAVNPGREAALDLLRRVYLTPEGQLLRFQTGGFLPTLRSLYTAPDFTSFRDEFLGGQESFLEYARAADDLPEFFLSANNEALVVAMGAPLLGLYAGDLTPAQVIRAATDSYRRQVRP
ncbi:ABC transporter substrate-binding protein [Streptomyces sp. DSM 44915]|uniref:ABC transporter substrate-binding protein n=1 Tax=Streptomyces chisholmiae TaxID=3075540 RepID=A0ABU2JUN5_9ACTN|nr:ABC transporter substrate-binding protein [Streptomyces sp. DSM 44915]MDT0268695.1 ABC transporter substrate-binding protein [Streptomyces sp. DSM 44915]